MKNPKLSRFYRQKSRLDYHPRKTLLAKREGLRKLISFDDRFLTVPGELENMINRLPKRAKVLDIGVGDGVYESLLSRAVRKKSDFYGIDLSEKQLKRASKFLKEAKVVDIDSQKVPYKKNFFDIVIASEILEHVFYPERVLEEATRVLKKGGYLVLTYPNSASLQMRLSVFFTGSSPLLNYPQNKEHIRFFTKADILKMTGGLEEVEYQGLGSFLLGSWNFPLKMITPRVLQVFGNKFLPGLALGNLLIFEK